MRASILGFALLCACSSSSTTNAPVVADASTVVDSAPFETAPVDTGFDSGLSGKCADTFGDQLTAGFGRIDGVIYAVQKPSDTACAMPNATHVVLQVRMKGAVYRMVVNVKSDRAGADVRVRFGTVKHALPAPAFAEGWHVDAPLDYVTSLGVHSDATFTPGTLEELVPKVAALLEVGRPVSVYAESGDGRPESAHLIHRNKTNRDGAIVVDPTGPSPTFLLFHFVDQVF